MYFLSASVFVVIKEKHNDRAPARSYM